MLLRYKLSRNFEDVVMRQFDIMSRGRLEALDPYSIYVDLIDEVYNKVSSAVESVMVDRMYEQSFDVGIVKYVKDIVG